MQTDIRAEPFHQRILVPLGASIAVVAAIVATAAIVLIATPPQDLTEAVSDGTAVAVLRAITGLIVDAFWWIVSIL